jgi:L-lysine 2,3-aminomutase
MVMSSSALRRYLEPLLYSSKTAHVSTIRIGTKSLSFWPYRYTTDPDASKVLRLFSEIVHAGKHLTIQAHFSHPRELYSPAVREATKLIRMTGANIRCQTPLIRHVNDDADTWTQMWNFQTRLGMIPYYMFVERDTGASPYFSVPLHRAYSIFSKAYARSSGTTRTVRGPSMSASPGKIGILGIETIAGEQVFLLKFFQARDPAWMGKVFFAKFDSRATWFDHLEPAFGEPSFFFEEGYREIVRRSSESSSGQLEHSE